MPEIGDYAFWWLASSTVLTWVGCAAAFVYTVWDLKSITKQRIATDKVLVILLLLLWLTFVVGLGIAGGRNSKHYTLTAFAAAQIVSAMGLIQIGKIAMLHLRNWKDWQTALLGGVLVVAQLGTSLSQFPYYYTYTNRLIHALTSYESYAIGYGEGLELAGDYLATKPDAQEITVLSWYAYAFSFHFPGHVEHIAISQIWAPSHIDRLEVSDYLVVYYTHQRGRNMPAKLLEDLEGVPIEHSIWLNGFEAVRIYAVNQLPDSVYIPDPASLEVSP